MLTESESQTTCFCGTGLRPATWVAANRVLRLARLADLLECGCSFQDVCACLCITENNIIKLDSRLSSYASISKIIMLALAYDLPKKIMNYVDPLNF